MTVEAIQIELEKKEDNAEQTAGIVIENDGLLPCVLAGLNSPVARVRFKSAKVIRTISEKKPEILYPHFGFFEKLLDSDNNILKWNAIDVIANLAGVDADDKFDRVFVKFYRLLDEGDLITSARVVEGSGKIARARPDLQDRITDELLRADRIPLPTEECRNIVKGKTIEAFARYFGQAKNNKPAMAAFVKSQLNNQRSSTRKKAEAFLKKFAVA